MQYHAQALAANGVDVDLVGFEGTPLPQADHRRSAHHASIASRLRRLRIRARAVRIELRRGRPARRRAASSFRLWRTLRRLPQPDLVLVQNPPAFPTLAVDLVLAAPRAACGSSSTGTISASRCCSCSWALASGGAAGAMVRASRRAPRRREPVRLARARRVSREPFRRDSSAQRPLRSPGVGVRAAWSAPSASSSARRCSRGSASAPATVGFIVCPTSWTEDEDFDLVIDAVPRLEERIRGWEAGQRRPAFPDLVILVTGDGARRAEFERRFAGLPARRFSCARAGSSPKTTRVSSAAPISGLCLHRSSSGLDIPMKVADLFGAGVPVCALDYGACLAERVRHGDNGLLFSTAGSWPMCCSISSRRFPRDQSSLDRLRTGARKSARPTWEEGWTGRRGRCCCREPHRPDLTDWHVGRRLAG